MTLESVLFCGAEGFWSRPNAWFILPIWVHTPYVNSICSIIVAWLTVRTTKRTDKHTDRQRYPCIAIYRILSFSSHFIDLFSCIAASLFNKLTYLLYSFKNAFVFAIFNKTCFCTFLFFGVFYFSLNIFMGRAVILWMLIDSKLSIIHIITLLLLFIIVTESRLIRLL